MVEKVNGEDELLVGASREEDELTGKTTCREGRSPSG